MKYADMDDEKAGKAVNECLRQIIGEYMPKRKKEGGVKIEWIRLALRNRLGMTENNVALFFTPTPVFDRLPEGEFSIRVRVLTPSGTILPRWEILSSEFTVT